MRHRVYQVYNHLGKRQSYVVVGTIIDRGEILKLGEQYLERVKFKLTNGSIVYEFLRT